MNIKRAKQEIRQTISAYLEKDENGEYRIEPVRQRPILLMGPPGIGKTQIMEQIAAECDLALVSYTITHHTRQSAIGLPFIREKSYVGQVRSVTEYTMSEIIAAIYDRMESSGKKEGILFIDEINCVSETLAPTMLQFLQGKTFGNQKVPEGWIITAAGNPPEYNRSVREFDVVTLDRVKVIPVEADLPAWREFAVAAGIHGSILAYLDIHKENFYRMETTPDGKRFVTARGWQDLSELLYAYERLGFEADSAVVMQYLQHPAVAKDFANYLALYYKYQTDYQTDEILRGVIRPGVLGKLKFAPFDEHLEVVGLLLARLQGNFRENLELDERTGDLFEVIREFGKRSGEAGGEAGVDAGEKAGETAAPADPAAAWQLLLDEVRQTGERREASGLTAKAVLARNRALVRAMEELGGILREEAGKAAGVGKNLTGEEAFDILKESFGLYRERLETHTDKTMEELEYAFDFMEAAFGESQEMVYFITELTVGEAGTKFLRENECPRYYRYNKSLLFEDREAAVRRRLSDVRARMAGADRGSGKAGRPQTPAE